VLPAGEWRRDVRGLADLGALLAEAGDAPAGVAA
jgi:hypothetical protein